MSEGPQTTGCRAPVTTPAEGEHAADVPGVARRALTGE